MAPPSPFRRPQEEAIICTENVRRGEGAGASLRSFLPPHPRHFSQGRSQALLLPQHREDVQRCPEALGVLRGPVPCDPKRFLPPDDICPIANCGS